MSVTETKVIVSYNRTERYCKKTTVVNGVTIPKGAAIVVPISLIHHSPLYWNNPEEFDPERLQYSLHAVTVRLKLDYVTKCAGSRQRKKPRDLKCATCHLVLVPVAVLG